MIKSRPETPETPETYEQLCDQISRLHEDFSPRLGQIAEFALANPNAMAFETVAQLADLAGVQPSSFIRFAKAVGYEGFSSMQQVFRARLLDHQPSYDERIRALRQRDPEGAGPYGLLNDFAIAATEGLAHLRETVRPEQLERAVSLLAGGSIVHVLGLRRSFPVAAYLAYAIGKLQRPVNLIDGIGGMLVEQTRCIKARDTLLAVSFRPYADETIGVVGEAHENRASIVCITDGPLSPLARMADSVLEVRDAEVEGFRALSATMCLALTLVVALGRRVENM